MTFERTRFRVQVKLQEAQNGRDTEDPTRGVPIPSRVGLIRRLCPKIAT